MTCRPCYVVCGETWSAGKGIVMSPLNDVAPEMIPEGFTRVNPETGELLVETEDGRDEIRFKIFKHFGVIGKSYQNRDIELNWVSWNDGFAKYDIRAWDRIHRHMSKGITLYSEEIIALRDLLNTIDFNRYRSKKPVSVSRKATAGQPAEPPAEEPAGQPAEPPSGPPAEAEKPVDKPAENE